MYKSPLQDAGHIVRAYMCYKVFYAFSPLSHTCSILQMVDTVAVFKKMNRASGSAVATVPATEWDLDLSPAFSPPRVFLAVDGPLISQRMLVSVN